MALHNGCYICKTVACEILVSIPTPPALAVDDQAMYSIAVCPDCARQHGR